MANKDLLLTFRSADQLIARRMLEHLATQAGESLAATCRRLIVDEFER